MKSVSFAIAIRKARLERLPRNVSFLVSAFLGSTLFVSSSLFAEEASDIRACLFDSGAASIVSVSEERVKKCVGRSLELCVKNWDTYHECITRVSENYWTLGIQREMAALRIDEDNSSKAKLELLAGFEDLLPNCEGFVDVDRSQCEAIIAVGYNIAISNKYYSERD